MVAEFSQANVGVDTDQWVQSHSTQLDDTHLFHAVHLQCTRKFDLQSLHTQDESCGVLNYLIQYG